jgi:ribosomal 50S subunit-recycling heat shock protein
VRLDVFLKRVGLIKRRDLAKEICKDGLVTMDGLVAKAGREVTPGRVVEVNFDGERLQIEVVGLPGRNYKKEQGQVFYRTIEHEYKDRYS